MNIYKLFCATTINTTTKKEDGALLQQQQQQQQQQIQANNNTLCKNFHPQMATKTQEQIISTTPHCNFQVYCFELQV